MSRGSVGWNSVKEGAVQKNVVSICSEGCLLLNTMTHLCKMMLHRAGQKRLVNCKLSKSQGTHEMRKYLWLEESNG